MYRAVLPCSFPKEFPPIKRASFLSVSLVRDASLSRAFCRVIKMPFWREITGRGTDVRLVFVRGKSPLVGCIAYTRWRPCSNASTTPRARFLHSDRRFHWKLESDGCGAFDRAIHHAVARKFVPIEYQASRCLLCMKWILQSNGRKRHCWY